MDANEFLKTTKVYTHSDLPVNLVWDDIVRAMNDFKLHDHIQDDKSVISKLTVEQHFHVTLVANLMRELVKEKIITPAQRFQVEHYILNKMGAR